MTITERENHATPGTLVQVGAASSKELSAHFGRRLPAEGELAPELALVLAAVLLAAAEQVSHRKLAAFGATSREDLTLLQLAMAFRADDTGLAGDVFEWSLLLALNGGDPVVAQLMSDALLLCGHGVDQPQGVLVAAEPGRLVAFSPQLPPGATLATGRRGRPPQVAKLLESADAHTWKADLLLGGPGERWVTASLKSNPRDLRRSLARAADTPHPPRIGITTSRRPGLTRDPETGAVIVDVPVHGLAMALSKVVLADVLAAFARHLSLPDAPLRRDATGIDRQLHRWQDRTVGYAATTLLQAGGPSVLPLMMWPPTDTGASVPDAHGSLIAVNTLATGEQSLREQAEMDQMSLAFARIRYAAFDPID